MGAEESRVELDESVRPQTLENRDLKSVARLIKDGKIKNIVVMTGAVSHKNLGAKKRNVGN